MPTLPQLLEEDIRELDSALRELLRQTEATTAIVIDKGGFVVTQFTLQDEFDTVTVAALAAASFAATEGMAALVSERNFTNVIQQGEVNSLLILNVDEYCLLTVVFRAQISVGAVKYYAAETIQRIAAQLRRAHDRAPDAGYDLSMLNLEDARPLFLKRTA
jgi:predicted regulator of Ras-like GTPase activity (Roadblock/LC7/MglB family)